jgi:hypothetical protein
MKTYSLVVLWRTDPLPGSDLEANKGTTPVAVQRRGKHASTIDLLLGKHVPAETFMYASGRKRGVVYAVRAENQFS